MPDSGHGLIESVPTAVCGAMMVAGARDIIACVSASAARGASPGVPRQRRTDRSLRNREASYIRLLRALLEPVPLERAYTSEELVVRLTALLGLVLDQGEFDGAEVIRHLLEAVVGHRGLAASDDPF